jgi:hypothetical protein
LLGPSVTGLRAAYEVTVTVEVEVSVSKGR